MTNMPKKKIKKEIPKTAKNNKQGSEQKTITCKICGSEIKLESVNLEEFEGGKLYLMEGVPAYVCHNCGETWVPNEVIEEFEKMMKVAKERRKPPQKTKKRKK